MSKELDERLEQMLVSGLDTVEMTDETDRRVLAGVHQQIRERSNIMRYPKKKLVVAIAAAVLVTGTITAVAAGKIVGLVSSSTGHDEAIHSAAELEKLAEKNLDADVHIAEILSDGSAFQAGFVTEVKGVDGDGNTVVTYPDVKAMYGADGQISLSIERVAAGIPEDTSPNQMEETYKGFVLGARADNYLFLPPDSTPSEEDLKLEAEGKLYISYGSSEVERESFKNVHWEKDGLKYLLFTFEDMGLEELTDIAKAYLDSAIAQ